MAPAPAATPAPAAAPATAAATAEEEIELTEEQVTKFNEIFLLFDVKQQGFFLSKDIGTALRTLGQYPTEAKIEEMVNQANMYNAGKVEFLNFVNLAIQGMKEVITDAELCEAFKVFDLEGNGTIPITDLHQFMTGFGEKLTEEEINEMIKQGDILQEGVVNYEEFVTRMNAPPPKKKKKGKKEEKKKK